MGLAVTPAITLMIDASYALAVVGVALSPWPWLALGVAAAYLGFGAWLADRRTETK